MVENYKDFAFSEYGRFGRALSLYEVGDREEAIAEMEDVSISLKGYPEIHAALAAALYADKHAPLLAENQFTIATTLDPHYTDLSYVKETKHWPPSLSKSMDSFMKNSTSYSLLLRYRKQTRKTIFNCAYTEREWELAVCLNIHDAAVVDFMKLEAPSF
ncbi:hypothetical protein OIU76_025052 [Salix suchowensis]|nr:hypothetical protein OIU76_025052 [Salix suchowensis]